MTLGIRYRIKRTNKNFTLKDRTWTCPNCGAIIDRDVNAATSIRNRDIADLTA